MATPEEEVRVGEQGVQEVEPEALEARRKLFREQIREMFGGSIVERVDRAYPERIHSLAWDPEEKRWFLTSISRKSL